MFIKQDSDIEDDIMLPEEGLVSVASNTQPIKPLSVEIL